MSATLERAVYDSAREVVKALQEQTLAINRMRDQLEEIWNALEGIRKEMAAANEQVAKLKY